MRINLTIYKLILTNQIKLGIAGEQILSEIVR